MTSDKIDARRSARRARQAAPPPGCQRGAAPSPPPPPPSRQPSGRLIPDTPIPFDLLRLADADVKLNVAQLKSGGALYRAIATHLDLHGGKLRLDPVRADLPEGHLDGALTADATQAAPPVALRLQIPALALQPLLAAVGKPAYVNGNLEVHADLRGAGATPHAIAASLDGSLGLAMANGTVDNRLLGSTLGSILREVNLLDLVGRGGTSQVQCFAARLDAEPAASPRCARWCSFVAAHHGRRRQHQPWHRDARPAPAAAGEVCRHRLSCRCGLTGSLRRRPPRPTRRPRSPATPEPWRARCWAAPTPLGLAEPAR